MFSSHVELGEAAIRRAEHSVARPAHPGRHPDECIYKKLLAPLGQKPSVIAECLFVDPILDLAILEQPDNQLFETLITMPLPAPPCRGSMTGYDKRSIKGALEFTGRSLFFDTSGGGRNTHNGVVVASPGSPGSGCGDRPRQGGADGITWPR
jgi:hypothetical protein